ncbi:glucokinase [Nisaea sp.]|uniref:glucokinase n=1 Tax=Nisaea sp. TaxID=2024842 RepID=UPI003266E025
MTARTLIGDLGGTNLRLALTNGTSVEAEARFRTADHPGLESVLDRYLESLPDTAWPVSAFLAVAGPVSGDRCKLTNCPWSFSRRAVAERFGWDRFRLMNDFSAVAAALPHFSDKDLLTVQTGANNGAAPKLVLGPGTGLGVGAVVPAEGGWAILDGEGGHVDLPCRDESGSELHQVLRRDGPVSAETVLSGAGLAALFNAVAEANDAGIRVVQGEDVTARLADTGCPVAREALDQFSSFLGAVAANAALTVGARGGVYLTGGVLGHAGNDFREDLFRAHFNGEGRMADYLAAIPVYRIRHPEPGLFGLRMLARGSSANQ